VDVVFFDVVRVVLEVGTVVYPYPPPADVEVVFFVLEVVGYPYPPPTDVDVVFTDVVLELLLLVDV
jgi:hypothetical protein